MGRDCIEIFVGVFFKEVSYTSSSQILITKLLVFLCEVICEENLFFFSGRVSCQNKHVTHILLALISKFMYPILANTMADNNAVGWTDGYMDVDRAKALLSVSADHISMSLGGKQRKVTETSRKTLLMFVPRKKNLADKQK